jgi:DNA-binding transcriptional LysR family regulator
MEPPVDIREIRVFLAVAEELHFARAAERLLLTPSRVSQTIRSLEAHVGGKLFDRTSRRVALTPLGSELQRELTIHFHAMQDALARAREAATGVAGTVRLGAYLPGYGGRHLAEIIRTFESRYPACRVTLVDTFSRDEWSWLRRDEVDLLASRLPVSEPDVTVGPRLSLEARVLLVARDHPLAQMASVSYEDVADYAVPDHPSVPREIIDAVIPRHTASGRPIPRVNLASTNEMVMRAAFGEIVYPTVGSTIEYVANPALVAVPIHDLPPSETALVWLASNRSLRVAAFVRAATDVLRTHPELA